MKATWGLLNGQTEKRRVAVALYGGERADPTILCPYFPIVSPNDATTTFASVPQFFHALVAKLSHKYYFVNG
jgi:hypothetical protein